MTFHLHELVQERNTLEKNNNKDDISVYSRDSRDITSSGKVRQKSKCMTQKAQFPRVVTQAASEEGRLSNIKFNANTSVPYLLSQV